MRWALIEMAGQERGECVVREFTNQYAAYAELLRRYPGDERERLHPDVAHWDEEGGFWSYDH